MLQARFVSMVGGRSKRARTGGFRSGVARLKAGWVQFPVLVHIDYRHYLVARKG